MAYMKTTSRLSSTFLRGFPSGNPITSFRSIPAVRLTLCRHIHDKSPSLAPNPLPQISSSVFETESPIFSSWKASRYIKFKEVHTSKETSMLDVTYSDGKKKSYPYVWLRDNCRCSDCFNAVAQSRNAKFKDLNIKCEVDETNFDADSVRLHWDDGHISEYPVNWLRANVFNESAPDPIMDLSPMLWDGQSVARRLRHFPFEDILNDDQALYEWLRELKLVGLAYITDTPLKEGELLRLAERVGYLQCSHYGLTSHVKSKVDPSNTAYTSGDFQVHTDMSYYHQPPGIVVLHCIKQATGVGGDNTLVDGFKIANDLRRDDPETFKFLTTNMFEFYDTGSDVYGDFYQQSRNYIIRLNNKNEVDKIVFSDHGRSSMLRMNVGEIIPAYKAMKAFTEQMYDPKNIFEYKMEDGNILTMDNYRILHGRNKFTMDSGTSRHLESCYFDWDLIMSKLRVTRRSLVKQGFDV